VPRGEHIRQGSDIVHAQRTLPSISARVQRGPSIDQRHSGSVEASQTAGRSNYSLRA